MAVSLLLFADDVTVFFPDEPFPEARVEGREAVLASFHEFFALVRKRGRTALNITPIHQRVQLYGEVAVVTFGLESDQSVGRRSIVLRKMGNDWRIVQLHAFALDNRSRHWSASWRSDFGLMRFTLVRPRSPARAVGGAKTEQGLSFVCWQLRGGRQGCLIWS